MINADSTTINKIMNHLTKLLQKDGYEVEFECIHTFEPEQLNNLENYHYCCELKKGMTI